MLLTFLWQLGIGSLWRNPKKAKGSSALPRKHTAVWNWDPYWLAPVECVLGLYTINKSINFVRFYIADAGPH